MNHYDFLLAAALTMTFDLGGARAAPVIDNERVTVWDVPLTKGVAGPTTSHDLDTVIMVLEGGEIKTTTADGRTSVTTRQFGDAFLIPKGSDAQETLISGGSAHVVMVALKTFKAASIANDSGLPAAFPRPGSVKRLENDRLIVWNYSWTPNVPTPMHFHDMDVVVVYRYDGDLKSVPTSGPDVVNPYKAGDIRFNKGNRSHFEVLVAGRQSAVMMELK